METFSAGIIYYTFSLITYWSTVVPFVNILENSDTTLDHRSYREISSLQSFILLFNKCSSFWMHFFVFLANAPFGKAIKRKLQSTHLSRNLLLLISQRTGAIANSFIATIHTMECVSWEVILSNKLQTINVKSKEKNIARPLYTLP